jgi:hypothetical protein
MLVALVCEEALLQVLVGVQLIVTPALAVRPLYTALMVALPTATPVARPFEGPLFIVATEALELDHVAELVTLVPLGDPQPFQATPAAV